MNAPLFGGSFYSVNLDFFCPANKNRARGLTRGGQPDKFDPNSSNPLVTLEVTGLGWAAE
jgi:hypothetical protein